MPDKFYIFVRDPEGNLTPSGLRRAGDAVEKVEVAPGAQTLGGATKEAVIQELKDLLPASVELVSDDTLFVLKTPDDIEFEALLGCECRCSMTSSCGGG